MATAANGRLTKKMDPHQKWRRSAPPVKGPRATAKPTTPVQTPMPTARSLGLVNVFVRMARAAGKMSAAAIPMRQRATISGWIEPDSPPNAENAAKAARPISSTPLRPYRSPRLPPTSRSTANTRE